MKKVFTVFLTILWILSLSTCSNRRQPSSEIAADTQENSALESTVSVPEDETTESEGNKTVNVNPIVYMTIDISP